MKFEESPQNKTLIDLASRVYDETELLEIVAFNGSINELNNKFPIECLRKEDGIYRASFLGNESIAVVIFDDSGKKLFGNIYRPQILKSDFDKLTEGSFLNEVKAIDPAGEYSFLYTGRNDTPKVSSHYTRDGYLITIEYDGNVIINIDKKMI